MDSSFRDLVTGPVVALAARREGALAAPREQPLDWFALLGSFQTELVCLGIQRYRVSREDAEDAFQAVVLAVIANRPSLSEPQNYVRAAFFNRLVDLVRVRARRPEAEAAEADSARQDSTERTLMAREACNALLGKLDRRSRRLVLRHLVDEIPLVDLAEEVGYSRKTVGKKFRRAMARLRTTAVEQASRRGPR